MTGVRPRAVVHRGVVEARGFVVENRVTTAAEARRRILALWRPGTLVQRLDGGWLVRMPAPLPVRCDRSPGLPLVAEGSVLYAMPLTAEQGRALKAPAGSLVRARDGTVVVEPLDEAPLEDPAAWLDLSAYTAARVEPMGEPPRPARVLVPARVRRGTKKLRALRSLLPQDQAGPSAREKVDARLKQIAAGLLRALSLGGFLVRQQAEYLRRLLEMFERGDLGDALRHAIPLGGLEPGSPTYPALGVPAPRSDLRLSLSRPSGGGRMGLSSNLFFELRRLYRRSFEFLAAQGRIEEAAFVLADLLRAEEEAVAFLESHGRLDLAAGLAEGRGLAPGLIVRQWFLAGDRGRAVWIARRTGAFADAVLRLERSQKKEEVHELRGLWASLLARAGDYAAAVEVLWPVRQARPLALGWMDQAIEQGGPPAARMLARKLALVPEQYGPVRTRVLTLLEDDSPEDAPSRQAFTDTLLEQTPPPAGAVTLARAAARSLIRDIGLLGSDPAGDRLSRLTELADDGALRADVPPLPTPTTVPLLARTEPLRLEIRGNDVGAMPAFDIAFLPNGQTLVALGEAGARLLSREGRTVVDFDQPAHRIVVSDHGDRAIALARRGEAWRLARLDLVSRRAQHWCEARIDVFARDYEGGLWFVATGRDVVAIDTAGRRFDGPWGVPDLDGTVVAIARSASRCSVLAAGRRFELWSYEAPSLTLRLRTDVPLGSGDLSTLPHRLALSPEGGLAELAAERDRHRLFVHRPTTCCPTALGLEDGEPAGLALNADWVACLLREATGIRLVLRDLKQGTTRAEVRLNRATKASSRLGSDILAAGDDVGRVLVVELDGGRVLRELRV